MTNERKCVSCGAPIPYGARRCEYCGMEYEPDYWAGMIRYVPLHMGRRKIVAETEIPNEFLKDAPEGIAKKARFDITHQIAEGLSEMVTLRMNNDWIRDVTIVKGEIWVEEPDKRTVFEGW